MPQLALSQVSIFSIFLNLVLSVRPLPLQILTPAGFAGFDPKPNLLAELAEAWGWAVCYERILRNVF